MSCAGWRGSGGPPGGGRRRATSAFVAGRFLRSRRPAWLRGLTVAWLGVVALSAGAQETGSTAPAAGAAEAEVEEASAARKTRGIEEILITSQGREQRLQEAAISAAVFNDDYIDAIGAQNIADISQFTPNLEIRTVFAATNPTIFIRGVGLRDFNANSASSVAVYNDDIYVNSPAAQLGQLFDLQSVEVLRGPQGALYGRNASAGVIKINARRPIGQFNGYTSVSYGSFNLIEVEGAVEVPIIDDLLSTRIAGRMNLRDGTTHNRCGDPKYANPAPNPDGLTPQALSLNSFAQRVHLECFNRDMTYYRGWVVGEPAPVAEWVNNRDNWAARWQLRLQPDDDIDVNLNVHGGQNRGQTRQFQMIPAIQGNTQSYPVPGGSDSNNYVDPDAQAPRYRCQRRGCFIQSLRSLTDPAEGDPFQGDYNLAGLELLDIWGVSLNGEYVTGDWRFQSISGYDWNERNVATNLDANPYIGLEPTLSNTSWQVTQEFKVFWEPDSSLSGQLGVTYLHEDLSAENYFAVGPFSPTRQNYVLTTDYGSPYAFLIWEPSEEFSVEGGMRWNVESKTMNLVTFRTEAGTRVYANPTAKDQAPSGDIAINYRPTEDVTFYAKYSHGWKGPHINGGILAPNQTSDDDIPVTSPVDPETVHAVELGLKSLWFDQRLKFNVAAFYYDYDDIQVFQLKNTDGATPVQQLINANDADNYGIEMELEARPFEGWAPEPLQGLIVYMSGAWLENYYTDYVNQLVSSGIGGTATAGTEDFSGNRLINSPRFSFAGYVQWDLQTDGRGSFTPRLDWTYKSEVFFNPANDPLVSQPALWLLNLRFAYRTPADTVEVAGWVRNLTNEVYRLDVFNLARFQREIAYAMGDPRTFGVTLSVLF